MTYLGLHQRGKIVSDSYKWSHNNSLSYFCSLPELVSQLFFFFSISGFKLVKLLPLRRTISQNAHYDNF